MDFLLNLTKEALYVVIGITGGAICALHFVSALTNEKIAKISQYVNIFLHIILFCELLLSEMKIEESVLVFMASVFLYVLVSYIKAVVDKKRLSKENGKESKSL